MVWDLVIIHVIIIHAIGKLHQKVIHIRNVCIRLRFYIETTIKSALTLEIIKNKPISKQAYKPLLSINISQFIDSLLDFQLSRDQRVSHLIQQLSYGNY